tara:strand:- start:24775 stop:26439 length:1665 start_codon:yes stop_codon:yes gene_type:complete
MSRARDIANLQSSKITADSGIDIDNITLEDNDISTTNSNGNLTITPNGTGDLYVNSDRLAVKAANDESATVLLGADNQDDAGDTWKITAQADHTLVFQNDKSGSSDVTHFSITPADPVANSIATFAGKATFANNVGIGTTSPETTVHIDGNVAIKNGSNYSGYFDVDGAVTLYHNGSQRIATQSTGVIVTGVTTSTGFSGKIHPVSGTTTNYLSLKDTNELNLFNASDVSQQLYINYDGGAVNLAGSNFNVAHSSSTGVKIDGSGNVQIGSDVGSYTVGDFNLFISNGANPTTIALYDDSGAYNSGLVKYDTNILSLGLNDANGANTLRTASAINIMSSGVGIGTTAPAEMLEIYNASAPAIQLNQNSDYQGIFRLNGNDLEIRGSSGDMEFYNGSADGDSSGLRFEILSTGALKAYFSSGNTYILNDGSNDKFYVNANGGIYNYQSNDSNLSDEREKKNISSLGSKWDAVKKWSLKEFHYNSDADSDSKKCGVIAQDIEDDHPNLITEFELTEDTTRKAVKEQQMMWMAIKALQEAMAKIETLEAEVTKLKGE